MYGAYTKTDGDVGAPRCRIVGGQRFPLFDYEKDDPCEFERILVSYNKHIDCNRQNFRTVNKVSKYDVAILKSERNTIVTTASALLTSMEKNRAIGRTFKDVMHAWERFPEQYEDYDGFVDNDPKPHHRLTKGMHISLLIGQDGKPYAWSDGSFCCYNNGKNKKEGTCTNGGEFAIGLGTYESFVKGGWAYYHEWGHTYDNGQVKILEQTNNLYSLMMERYFDR